jgi:hypothetical protein
MEHRRGLKYKQEQQGNWHWLTRRGREKWNEREANKQNNTQTHKKPVHRQWMTNSTSHQIRKVFQTSQTISTEFKQSFHFHYFYFIILREAGVKYKRWCISLNDITISSKHTLKSRYRGTWCKYSGEVDQRKIKQKTTTNRQKIKRRERLDTHWHLPKSYNHWSLKWYENPHIGKKRQ